jgi:PPM family protein phosphatase
MFKFISYGKTDVGLRRSNNEDTFIVGTELGLCLVADGMGGAAAGELASQIFSQTAIEVFSKARNRSEAETAKRVQQVFEIANDRILTHAKENPHCTGMGCTAELFALSNTGFVLGHIGDSRTYRLENNRLKQLTQDHSLVQDQLNKGVITPAEARHHSLRNVILRAVGVEQNLIVDMVLGKTVLGDTFLLCSDGLTDMVVDEQILEIVLKPIPMPLIVDNLIELAKAAGGHDNVTVTMIEIS